MPVNPEQKGSSMQNKITIRKDNVPCYQILLAEDFSSLGAALEKLQIEGRKICIVSDSNVAPLYLENIRTVFSALTDVITGFVFQAGEENKTLSTVEDLYEHLILNRFERKDLLVALGGGVVGDLTGYAAATYLRGIRFIQIPTTLLAQVDSSIGGKTGVDFRAYKNMVGAFHQPVLVYSASHTLMSLSDRIYYEGMGEIIKHGLICDREYTQWLISHKQEISSREVSCITDMVRVSDQIKQKVVEEDPQEQGIRAILNFGHTLGHAVEKLAGFKLLHGECVSIGIRGAAWLSMQRGYISNEDYKKIIELLKLYHLPVSVSGISAKEIAVMTKSDKKMDQGSIRFILLDSPGKAVICHDVTDAELLAAANEICHE